MGDDVGCERCRILRRQYADAVADEKRVANQLRLATAASPDSLPFLRARMASALRLRALVQSAIG
jgi:hypothetical protein